MRMFCSLDDEALADFELIGVSATLPRGATLFLENAPSQAVYVVCTGQVKLSCTSKDGRTLILKIAMPGDILGLGAVISGSKYEVTAETVQPSEVKSIRRDEFLAFLKKHGNASLHAALTHEELANLVGCSRETMTRMLGRFKREKLIQIHGVSILILSPEKLERISV
jgi:CRP/FNR family transcriptional regulator